jgi:hypothetical protein
MQEGEDTGLIVGQEGCESTCDVCTLDVPLAGLVCWLFWCVDVVSGEVDFLQLISLPTLLPLFFIPVFSLMSEPISVFQPFQSLYQSFNRPILQNLLLQNFSLCSI